MSDHPHNLTPGWTAEEIAADLVTLRKVLARYEALSTWQCVRHPSRQRHELIGLVKYAFEAVRELQAVKEARP